MLLFEASVWNLSGRRSLDHRDTVSFYHASPFLFSCFLAATFISNALAAHHLSICVFQAKLNPLLMSLHLFWTSFLATEVEVGK